MIVSYFVDSLKINKGDIILLTGDLTSLLLKIIQKNNNKKIIIKIINQIIDIIIKKIGKDGTLLIHAFNWDFCKGLAFDIKRSKCQTGILGKIALEREDFLRTQHPIYSFAVYGKYAYYLSNLNNKGSFSCDSPFGFLHKKNGKQIIIDMSLKDSFTFSHYVETINNVSYRFNKTFTALYTDIENKTEIRQYDMYVRNLELGVINNIEPLENIFIQNKAMCIDYFYGIKIRTVNLAMAFDIIENDIINNKAKNLYQIIKK
ncbi:aminoglycoside N3'-acetyltransferase [Campylobacter pinnipediorum subsp. caledonicus]|uniref:Aminoglycoside N(3)-acetyltransferase n=1 Tax=Campylobacter pinnipediorum subsp. caledonicus TaxID=1874362 RepID=A0A1S6U9P0_9BACT|nr:AAC(3) family N-acetyltransferase [Campylobacter pinnipediorum]AQW86801.1 aminoglycoside N3'-acetyltransferase [Campylobacter pinnipediorum subsp. caledonicus]AQW88456.1 aminoglycoside N3'-acetyltransferase [Campylobacter pinnipediorum subsp. caledonicus]